MVIYYKYYIVFKMSFSTTASTTASSSPMTKKRRLGVMERTIAHVEVLYKDMSDHKVNVEHKHKHKVKVYPDQDAPQFPPGRWTGDPGVRRNPRLRKLRLDPRFNA